MKPALLLCLFLLSIVCNAIATDKHLQLDESHSNDAPHVHLPLNHLHNDDHPPSDSPEHLQEHEDSHVHLCFHLLPLQVITMNASELNAELPRSPLRHYFGLAHQPPVPPPTA